MEQLLQALHDEVHDPEEDAFLVFSQPVPSHALGIIDNKASSLELTVAGRDLTISQSPGLLTSNRALGSTGAVVWKVTPHFAEWIASEGNLLFRSQALGSDSTVLELGAGVAGIVPLALAPSVSRYIATDQDYVLKLLRQNIADNSSASKVGAKRGKSQKGRAGAKAQDTSSAGKIETLTLDWESDSVASLPQQLNRQVGGISPAEAGVDAIIACDCIYNDHLIEPFVNTCADICALRPQEEGVKPTICIIAQQLRTHEIFESWLVAFHRRFRVWKLPDEHMPKELREDSGFIVHVGILR
ncbi:uncharacterized protein K452DRAFT_353003 [Aplosporella prunicola CBS 121167]|uniref:Diaminohydroxyphosphoribosylamino-pyrimidine deaminase n=1 Tax=Aplosporella prunicola CBS 121167 TaxID=1176127 RepID=A0A6A6B5B1_9PEZI|nr:uncharacterized protein K452DRAFT_353003 [Aplosporella prunicola CBS 121167]KAF2138455.1 hypothetical protein K452DRAFT_353003 [Aplosporella prunicola CBS 121167]